MDNIINDNYQSIVDRGLISPTTTLFEFLDKLDEEVKELKYSIVDYVDYDSQKFNNVKEELADVIMVCFNMAKHYDVDIKQEIKNKIKINKYRAKNEKKT